MSVEDHRISNHVDIYNRMQNQSYYIFLHDFTFMIEEKTLNRERDIHYVKIDMYKAPLILIRGKNAYVMCGYLNIQTAEKLGDAGALVRGVKDLQTMMNATIEETTTLAESIGIKKGKKVEEVIDLL